MLLCVMSLLIILVHGCHTVLLPLPKGDVMHMSLICTVIGLSLMGVVGNSVCSDRGIVVY